ncbi:MAG: DUF1553 domain-containing protein [Fuerstiella sp.]|nr:DUF1553 domain-containing protein [Fuerstiella sp.]MCP4852913.1 DUF1553 domain-containing protein [Fuerstiella sp.]
MIRVAAHLQGSAPVIERRWLASRKNPSTARVAVNHIWLRHFGQASVETVSDFGRRSGCNDRRTCVCSRQGRRRFSPQSVLHSFARQTWSIRLDV